MTADEEDRIVGLYSDGLSIRQIARIVFWSPRAVSNCLIRRSVMLRPKGGNRRVMPVAESQATIMLYQAGYSIDDVARIVGRTRTCVHRRLVVAGVPRRPRGSAGRKLVTRRLPA